MTCGPPGAGGTGKEALISPVASAETAPRATSSPNRTRIPDSLAPKPDPVTVTSSPGIPLVEDMVTMGVTLKLTTGSSLPSGVTLTAVTVCKPPGEDGTTKEWMKLPAASALTPVATVCPE